MQMTTLNIRIPIEVKNDLDKIAVEKKRKKTTLARLIIENYVKNYNL